MTILTFDAKNKCTKNSFLSCEV